MIRQTEHRWTQQKQNKLQVTVIPTWTGINMQKVNILYRKLGGAMLSLTVIGRKILTFEMRIISNQSKWRKGSWSDDPDILWYLPSLWDKNV